MSFLDISAQNAKCPCKRGSTTFAGFVQAFLHIETFQPVYAFNQKELKDLKSFLKLFIGSLI